MLKHSSTPPEGWIETRLFEICAMKSGNGITSSLLDEHSKYPCYGGNGIRGYTRNYTHDGTYALIGRQGALCGNVNSASGKFFASEHAIVVAAKNNIDINWLTHVLQEGNLNQYSESSAQPGLSVSKILTLPVTVPPLAEQLKIARSLSDVDALLAKLDQLIAKKSDIKIGAMQELLTGKRRLPGFSGKWTSKRVDSLAVVDPEQLGASTDPDFEMRYISLENVNKGRLLGCTTVTFAEAPSRARRKIADGDILVSTVRPNLQSHLLFSEPGQDWVCSTGFSVVRCKKNVAHPGFLFQSLFSRSIESQIDKLISGSNYPAINSSDVKALEIITPEFDEQFAIATVLSDMDNEITQLRQKRSKLTAIKQGMMQQLLTGKIRLV